VWPIWKDLLNLVYPDLCLGCNCSLLTDEDLICYQCQTTLVLPLLRRADEDPFLKSGLIGLPIEAVFALMAYQKHGISQRLLHQLKYHNQPRLGLILGRLLGLAILKQEEKPLFTVVVPVPLHPKRQRSRGYNQATQIAIGLAEHLQIPIREDLLLRPKVTESQTQKDRGQRLENMKKAFVVNIDDSPNQHVLLVDDVITTGATIGSCARLLLNAGVEQVSIAALAIA